MFILKVLVQLPDGTFKRCPIAHLRDSDDKPEVRKHPSEMDAGCWAQFILPDRVEVYDEE